MRPASRSTIACAVPLDMRHLRIRLGLEQLDGEMAAAARARRPECELVRTLFCKRDELFERFDRQGRVHDDYLRRKADHRDGHEILERIVGDLGLQHGIAHVAEAPEPQRVAIGGAFRHVLDTDVAACAPAIVYHHRDPQRFLGALCRDARHEVCNPARDVRDDQARRTSGVCLRACRGACQQCNGDRITGFTHGRKASGVDTQRRLAFCAGCGEQRRRVSLAPTRATDSPGSRVFRCPLSPRAPYFRRAVRPAGAPRRLLAWQR